MGFIPCARTCSLAKFNNDAGCRPVLGVVEGGGGIKGENRASNDKSCDKPDPAGVEVRRPSGGELLVDDGDPYKISYGLNPDASAA